MCSALVWITSGWTALFRTWRTVVQHGWPVLGAAQCAATRAAAAVMVDDPGTPQPTARQRYRALVENAGARFEHHDGGVEDQVSRLDALLTGADLVVATAAVSTTKPNGASSATANARAHPASTWKGPA
jgi:hypothetical protein